MQIKQIIDKKEKYLNLLLEADTDKEVVKKYINNSDMYGIFEKDECVCEVVITKVDENTCELKNIATLKEARGKGYAKKIIQYVFNKYKDIYKTMIVGTTENMIPFYVLNGFTKYHHTAKNFFLDNYTKNIYDGNLQCIDMYYYARDFDKGLNYKIERIDENLRERTNKILQKEWGSTDITIRGKVIDGTKLDGYVALKDGEIIGLVTYITGGNECEICSLNSFIENKGVGTTLVNKVKEYAKQNNCTRLKLVTTNDNIRGIEFYQKRGFIFAYLYRNSMETERKLKPEIPLYADNGLPVRDEIEFEFKL